VPCCEGQGQPPIRPLSLPPGKKAYVIQPFRKLFRLTGLLFPALYLWTSKEVTLAFTIVLLGFFLGLEGLRFRRSAVNEALFRYGSVILRKEERTRLTAITWFLLGALPTVLFFTRQVAVTAWFFFLFGDVAAELVGTRWGRTRVLGKTLEGSLACLTTCLIVGLAAWAWLRTPWSAVVAGALAATVIELLPLPMDDNFTVPLIAGLAMMPFAG